MPRLSQAVLWENLSSGGLTRSDTNRAVQTRKITRVLKLWIKEVEGLYYLCSENKGVVTAQLIYAFVFAYSKSWFSLDVEY